MNRSQPERPTLLVIDDDPASLGMMDAQLEATGYNVRIALSGRSGLDILSRTRIDLVLVDACMPGLTGWDVCTTMRADPTLTIIPVIFMTGLTETEHVLRAFECGAVDYITKPFNFAEVEARLAVRLAAARRIALAHAALDRAGRFFFSVSPEGSLLWATPQAQDLLSGVPPHIMTGLAARAQNGAPGTVLNRVASGPDDLEIRMVGQSAPQEYLLKIERIARDPALVLQQAFALSTREAEVLLWITRGKSSRDIAEILGISSRTIDKHTEQIYNKAGFNSRASAAAAASRHLDMRSSDDRTDQRMV